MEYTLEKPFPYSGSQVLGGQRRHQCLLLGRCVESNAQILGGDYLP